MSRTRSRFVLTKSKGYVPREEDGGKGVSIRKDKNITERRVEVEFFKIGGKFYIEYDGGRTSEVGLQRRRSVEKL